MRYCFQCGLLFFLLITSWKTNAQLPNGLFNDTLRVEAKRAKQLYLGISNLNYTKNNEYFNKIADGYTLFGYQLNPKLIYYPSENLRIEGGVFLWKDFGNEKFTKVLPTFTLKYQRDSLAFLFGNLEGSLQHGLVEPLYDFEKVMLDRLENGMQLLYKHKNYKLDAWIDWQRMLYPAGKYQEEVSGGMATEVYIYRKNALQITAPLQFVAYHKGGQIDSVPNPLMSIFNSSAGLKAAYRPNKQGFWRGITGEYAFVYFTDFSFDKQLPFANGRGQYANVTFHTKPFDLMVSYWNGTGYMSTRGGALYQSVQQAWRNDSFYKLSGQNIATGQGIYTEKERQLLIVRLLQEIKLFKSVYVSGRFEPFYDLNNKKFQFSHGLYVTYRHNFFLKTIEGD